VWLCVCNSHIYIYIYKCICFFSLELYLSTYIHSHTHTPFCGSSLSVNYVDMCVLHTQPHTTTDIYHPVAPPSLCILCIYRYIDTESNICTYMWLDISLERNMYICTYTYESCTHTPAHIYHPVAPPSLCILCICIYVSCTHTATHVYPHMALPFSAYTMYIYIYICELHTPPPTHMHTHVPSYGSSFSVYIRCIYIYIYLSRTHQHTGTHIYPLVDPPSLCILCIFM